MRFNCLVCENVTMNECFVNLNTFNFQNLPSSVYIGKWISFECLNEN